MSDKKKSTFPADDFHKLVEDGEKLIEKIEKALETPAKT